MMKVGEWEARRASTTKSNRELRVEAFQQLLGSLSDLPVYQAPANDVGDYAKFRDGLRETLRLAAEGVPGAMNSLALLDLACDHCGTHLLDTDVGTQRTSSPPRFQVGCAGCGWVTYLDVAARSLRWTA